LIKSNPKVVLSIFLLSLTSELLDQSASVSKSFVTTLLALPKEKSLPLATILYPIHIALLSLLAEGSVETPIQTLLLPVVVTSPAF
jgi:hypothetical protein